MNPPGVSFIFTPYFVVMYERHQFRGVWLSLLGYCLHSDVCIIKQFVRIVSW